MEGGRGRGRGVTISMSPVAYLAVQGQTTAPTEAKTTNVLKGLGRGSIGRQPESLPYSGSSTATDNDDTGESSSSHSSMQYLPKNANQPFPEELKKPSPPSNVSKHTISHKGSGDASIPMGRGEAVQYGTMKSPYDSGSSPNNPQNRPGYGGTSLTRNAQGHTIVVEKKTPSVQSCTESRPDPGFSVGARSDKGSAIQPDIQKPHPRLQYQVIHTSPVNQWQGDLNPSRTIGVSNIGKAEMSDSSNDNYLVCDDLGGTCFDMDLISERDAVQQQSYNRALPHQTPPAQHARQPPFPTNTNILSRQSPQKDPANRESTTANLPSDTKTRDMVQQQGYGVLQHQAQHARQPPFPTNTNIVSRQSTQKDPANRESTTAPSKKIPSDMITRDMVQQQSYRALPHQTPPAQHTRQPPFSTNTNILSRQSPQKVEMSDSSNDNYLVCDDLGGTGFDMDLISERDAVQQQSYNRALPHQTPPAQHARQPPFPTNTNILSRQSPQKDPANRESTTANLPSDTIARDMVQQQGYRVLQHQAQHARQPPFPTNTNILSRQSTQKDPANRESTTAPSKKIPSDTIARDMVQQQDYRTLPHQAQHSRQPPFPTNTNILSRKSPQKDPANRESTPEPSNLHSARDMVQQQGYRALPHQTLPAQHVSRQPPPPSTTNILSRQSPQKDSANRESTPEPSFKDSTGQIWVAPSSEQGSEHFNDRQEKWMSQGMGNCRSHPDQGSGNWRGSPDQGKGNWRGYQDQGKGNWRVQSNQDIGNWRNRDQRQDNRRPSNQRPVNRPDQISANRSSPSNQGSSNWRSPVQEITNNWRGQSTQIKEPISKPAVLSADDLTKEQKKNEFEWQRFKVVRKVKKALSSVKMDEIKSNAKEISDILDSEMPRLAPFPAAWPKERHVALEEILDKAIQDEEFLPIAGHLMKELFELKPERFKEILIEVLTRKEPDYVKVSTATNSDKVRASYCSYLTSVMAASVTPREDAKFKAIVEDAIMKLIQRWLYFDVKGEHSEMEEYLNVLGSCLAELVKLLLPSLDNDQQRRMFNLIKDKALTDGPRKMKLSMLSLLLQWSSGWKEDLFCTEYLNDPDTSGPFMKVTSKSSTDDSNSIKDIQSATISSADGKDVGTSGGGSSVEVEASVDAKETTESSDKPAESGGKPVANTTQVSSSESANWWEDEEDSVEGIEGKPSANTTPVSSWCEEDMVERNAPKQTADNVNSAETKEPANVGNWWEDEEKVVKSGADQTSDKGAIDARVVVPFSEVEGSTGGEGTDPNTTEAKNEEEICVSKQRLERKINPKQQFPNKETEESQRVKDIECITPVKMTRPQQGSHSSSKQTTRRKGSSSIKQCILGCHFPSLDNDVAKSPDDNDEAATAAAQEWSGENISESTSKPEDPSKTHTTVICNITSDRCQTPADGDHPDALCSLQDPEEAEFETNSRRNQIDLLSTISWTSSLLGKGFRKLVGTYQSPSNKASTHSGEESVPVDFGSSVDKGKEPSTEQADHLSKREPITDGDNENPGRVVISHKFDADGNGDMIQKQKSNPEDNIDESEVLFISDSSSPCTNMINSNQWTINSGPPSLIHLSPALTRLEQVTDESSHSVTPNSLPDLLKCENSTAAEEHNIHPVLNVSSDIDKNQSDHSRKKEKWHPFISYNDSMSLSLTSESTDSVDSEVMHNDNVSKSKKHGILKAGQKSSSHRQCHICHSKKHNTKDCQIHKKLSQKLVEKLKEAKTEVIQLQGRLPQEPPPEGTVLEFGGSSR